MRAKGWAAGWAPSRVQTARITVSCAILARRYRCSGLKIPDRDMANVALLLMALPSLSAYVRNLAHTPNSLDPPRRGAQGRWRSIAIDSNGRTPDPPAVGEKNGRSLRRSGSPIPPSTAICKLGRIFAWNCCSSLTHFPSWFYSTLDESPAPSRRSGRACVTPETLKRHQIASHIL
jgi:hypothetical protein